MKVAWQPVELSAGGLSAGPHIRFKVQGCSSWLRLAQNLAAQLAFWPSGTINFLPAPAEIQLHGRGVAWEGDGRAETVWALWQTAGVLAHCQPYQATKAICKPSTLRGVGDCDLGHRGPLLPWIGIWPDYCFYQSVINTYLPLACFVFSTSELTFLQQARAWLPDNVGDTALKA